MATPETASAVPAPTDIALKTDRRLPWFFGRGMAAERLEIANRLTEGLVRDKTRGGGHTGLRPSEGIFPCFAVAAVYSGEQNGLHQMSYFRALSTEIIPAYLMRYLTRTMHSRTFSPMVAEITVEPRTARFTSPVSLTVTTAASALAHFTSPS